MEAVTSRLARFGNLPELGLGARTQAQVEAQFTRPFMALHCVCELYASRIALALALDLGWEAQLRRGASLAELVTGMAPQARLPAAWMLTFLEEEGLLSLVSGRYLLEGEPDLELQGLRDFAETQVPGQGVNFDLFDAIRARILPFFTEGKPGEPLLFDLAVLPLWLAYFGNDNRVYRPNNLFALAGLRDGLPEGARVLEVGGGSGSFARMLHQDAQEAGYLGRIKDYCFTDITPTFLRRAQRELPADTPGLPLRFAPLDLNRDFAAQGFQAGQFDAIVGVNVFHVAQDLRGSLARVRSLLAPGGRLILGECLKPDLDHPIYLEFFFKFMKGFMEVDLHPELRPAAGFLTPELWEKVLRAAGFSAIRRVPDTRAVMAALPTFYVGALEASLLEMR